MRKLIITLLLLSPVIMKAQIITTVAGCDTCTNHGDGIPATAAALGGVGGLFFDHSNNMYICDPVDNKIRKVSAATGVISTLISLDEPWGGCFNAAGDIYIMQPGYVQRFDTTTHALTVVAGTGSVGFSGDGGPATDADFSGTNSGIAIDAAGNFYVADFNNFRIRKVTVSTGKISTIAGGGSSLGEGVAATVASLNNPTGVAIDAGGNVYVSAQNQTIRKVAAGTGNITTVAGQMYVSAYAGDGGPATNANLNFPNGLALDSYNNIYIADKDNYLVRKVFTASHTITSIAGNNIAGYMGDGGPATSAELQEASQVALDNFGNVYIGDGNVVRKITAGPTSVAPVASSGPFVITPNPASDIVTIAAHDLITHVDVSDLAGHVLFSGRYNTTTIHLDVARLPPGMYLLTINGAGRSKFVKQ